MARRKITLKVAGVEYPFQDVETSEEEVYRHAEREVNRLFAENAHPDLLPKDRLALAAIALAMEKIRLTTSRSLGEEIDRLVDIERRIDEYIGSTEK